MNTTKDLSRHLISLEFFAHYENRSLDSVLGDAVDAYREASKKKNENRLIKQNMVITASHYELLNKLATRIQWNKQKHPERITINTVLRCLIALLDDFEADVSKVVREEDLLVLLRTHFR